jgi:hypothetical protein
MKLFYKVSPQDYERVIQEIQIMFNMHKDVDEERTILSLDGDGVIEQVMGSYDPSRDEVVQVRVVINDESLRATFDDILGSPFLVK